MSHAGQYSKLETQELQSILDTCNDPMTKLAVISELKKRQESSAIVDAVKIANKLHLPYTDTDQSPLPNLFLRSNLFSASKTHGKKDEPVRNFKITCYHSDKEELLLTSYREFNQLDLDLLIVLLSLQQEQDSNYVKTTMYEISTMTTGHHGKNQYEAILEQLEAFRNANLKFKFKGQGFVGGILQNIWFDDIEKKYIIEFNPKLQPLFSTHNWTKLDLNIRSNLKSNLAKWLHGFYSSHLNSNFPIKSETIYLLSGANDSNIRRWTSVRLVESLEELKNSYESLNLKFEYSLEKCLLKVKKSQSNSQNKSMKSKIISTKTLKK